MESTELAPAPAFSTSPDPTAMYQTEAIRHALTKIRRAVARKQGLCCIFGDVGMGKSSLLRALYSGFSADENYEAAFLATGDYPSSFAFVKTIAAEFELPPARSRMAQMDTLEEFLIDRHTAGKNVAILIDEAQLLSLDYLEVIRSLLNFETYSSKLCQIILSGQLDLRDRLEMKRYRAFRSRIVAPVVMRPLTADETEAMIAYRLTYWGMSNPFTAEATRRIYELTGGVPRTILLVCQYAFDIGQARGQEVIGPAIIEAGFDELSIKVA
jgi:type II secretory pathway predicted ATPase ExeA